MSYVRITLECDVQVVSTSKPDLVVIIIQAEKNCLNHSIPKTVVTDASSTSSEQKKNWISVKKGLPICPIYCKTLYFRVPFIFASFAFALLTKI